MYPLADEAPGRVWNDALALGAANEMLAAIGPRALTSPADRRHYLAFLAEQRAAKPSARRGSSRDELSRRLRALALHLDRRQVAANQRERRALIVHPAIRLSPTISDPIEVEQPLEHILRAEAEAEWQRRGGGGERRRELDRLRKRKARARQKAVAA